MDGIDAEILSTLQADGRATVVEVASRVGSSLSACHRRVRNPETSGAIRGHRAELDLELLGLPFEAIGTVIKPGRTLTVCHLEVRSHAKDKRRLVATGQQTSIRVRG